MSLLILHIYVTLKLSHLHQKTFSVDSQIGKLCRPYISAAAIQLCVVVQRQSKIECKRRNLAAFILSDKTFFFFFKQNPVTVWIRPAGCSLPASPAVDPCCSWKHGLQTSSVSITREPHREVQNSTCLLTLAALESRPYFLKFNMHRNHLGNL